MISIVVQEAAV